MNIRLAYMHKTFPGQFSPLVEYLAACGDISAAFLAERWARTAPVQTVRRVRIPGPSPEQAQRPLALQTAEGKMTSLIRNAAKAGDVLLHLRKGGFVPDVIYATADEGYLLYARDVFPKARIVVHLNSLFRPEAEDTEQVRGSGARLKQAALGRTHNCFVLSALNDCHLSIVSSLWQWDMFSPACPAGKIAKINKGVDTKIFHPAPATGEEVVTFSCQGTNAARGIDDICDCLPLLLSRRPRCRVRLVSFAPFRAEAAQERHGEELATLLPSLDREQRERVEIIVSPQRDAYVKVLQSSAVYVYLTRPSWLSAGILEALSCGTLVIASDTGPVRELIRHKENGFLHSGRGAEALAAHVEDVLARGPELAAVRRQARETVLEHHDLKKILPHHASLVQWA